MADTLQKPILLPVLKAALEKVMQRTITAESLGTAIAASDLQLHYQPKLARQGDGSWAIEGAEALMRWYHPELGMLMPAEFIPLAAQAGLSDAVTDLALRGGGGTARRVAGTRAGAQRRGQHPARYSH
jgi:EAL domain-containing protein (putative c-di-GMP-specific phosphodiesterase class I)